ncbi:MAG: hypothetical protein IJ408_02480 [Clostridia bacterium]|nr:hypothetical protein [Clostridia bacterium]
MKRIICICSALLLVFAVCGCVFVPGVKEIVSLEHEDYVYGEITDKISADILVLEVSTQSMKDDWGETVHVVTKQAAEWSVGDQIEVIFEQVERFKNSSKCVRIIAKEVTQLQLDAKPVIYLYPQEPTQCTVKLTYDGKLTCVYPSFNPDCWKDFTAFPDGTLVFPDGREYYALYWEGVRHAEWDLSCGYCVKGEDTAKFLEWALERQGLTPREANEFIVYWLPKMQENPYNVISFQKEAYTDFAKLDIEPAPDNLLRVFMTYYPSSEYVDIKPQSFEEFDRSGFTVVEWGGSQTK